MLSSSLSPPSLAIDLYCYRLPGLVLLLTHLSLSDPQEPVTQHHGHSALGRVRSHTTKSSTSHGGITSGSAGGETTDSDSDYVPPGGNHSNYRYISYNNAPASNGRSRLGQSESNDTVMASVKEEDVGHEFDLGKAPRSLLGITNVAGQDAHLPMQPGTSFGHARRHTIGDTRSLFAGGQTMADFLENSQEMPEPVSARYRFEICCFTHTFPDI